MAATSRERGYSPIISFNTDTNVASIRMIERCGFVRTGLIRHIGVESGKPVNLAVFQLIFSENLPRYQRRSADPGAVRLLGPGPANGEYAARR